MDILDWETLLINAGLENFIEDFKERRYDSLSLWKYLDEFDLRQVGFRAKDLLLWEEEVS